MRSRVLLIPAGLALAPASVIAGCSSGGGSNASTAKTVTVTASPASHPSPSSSSPSPAASPSSSSPSPVATSSSAQAQAPATQQQNGCAPLTATEASAIGGTIAQYFGGITGGEYAQAWNTLTAHNQSTTTYSQFQAALETSTDLNVTFRGEFVDSRCQDVAEVAFTSYQAPQYAPNGADSCDNWDLYYVMVPQPGGYYLIDSAEPAHGGQAWSTC